jgi:hypothetical protein
MCPDAEELAAFVDDGVPPAARIRIIGHLARCSPCRHVVTQSVQLAERSPGGEWEDL